ncbi:NACHT domain-containing protein [Micromonospora sp. NPDC051925]|uniref:NACHT domain-containing protein n=1 Tax=Micromonospora sp. NPDC051925 TaxID=3364288 RepID=UPI0037CC536F
MANPHLPWRWFLLFGGMVGITIFVVVAFSIPSAGLLVALVSFIAGPSYLIYRRLRRQAMPMGQPPNQLEAAEKKLAQDVERKWREELRRWSLNDPEPIRVRWRLADEKVMDRVEVIVGRKTAGRILRLQPWRGSTDEIGSVAEHLRSSSLKRAVVLGAPGTGKTVFAALLVLALCERRHHGHREPVPVLLSLSSWDPKVSLRDWVIDELSRQHPALRDSEYYGVGAVEGLVRNRMVMPILDGLDELAEGRRAASVEAINDAFGTDHPVLVTCRSEEYLAALERGGQVLTGAYVIEAEPLGLDDLLDYLRRSVPRQREPRWAGVFDQLARTPDGPLTVAVRTPLMAWLLRTVYRDGARDPALLLDQERFPTSSAIESHLLDGLIPTVVARARAVGIRELGLTRLPEVERTVQFLGFLAGHLETLGIRDIAWWNLRLAVPALTQKWSRASLAGVLSWLVASLVLAVPMVAWLGVDGLGISMVIGLTFGVTVAVTVLLAPARASKPSDFHAPFDWAVTGRIVKRTVLAGATNFVITAAAFFALLTWYGEADAAILALGGGFMVANLSAIPYGFSASAGLLTPPGKLGHLTVHIRGRKRLLLDNLGAGLANGLRQGATAGTAIGLAFFVPAALLIGIWEGLGAGMGTTADERATFVLSPGIMIIAGLVVGTAWGFVWGVLVGSGIGLVLGFNAWAASPMSADQAARPLSTLRANRWLYIFLVTLLSVAFAFVFAFVFALVAGLISLMSHDSLGAEVVGLAALGAVLGCLMGAFSGEWPYYLVARTWLALCRKLPWRLQTFLDDAHRLGLLRQVGAVHQFRHATFQQHLATLHGAGGPGRGRRQRGET